jgi:hypothetical protein
MTHTHATRTVAGMSAPDTIPPLRESVDELADRLERICASTATLRNLSAEIRHGIPPATLVTLTEQLEHDLTLATRQLELVHDRAALELSSIRDTPASP